ncbi:hypothetical protein BC834DRAFT_905705 [Gloeopeniophorella convolvens]|nr:hypothetical protein BC834DRAFT_905705 [Gloeopeniophorella convolvens]
MPSSFGRILGELFLQTTKLRGRASLLILFSLSGSRLPPPPNPASGRKCFCGP